jgi:hypothetical protein
VQCGGSDAMNDYSLCRHWNAGYVFYGYSVAVAGS